LLTWLFLAVSAAARPGGRGLAERLALPDALAVVDDCLTLVVEVELEHGLGPGRRHDLARNRGGRAAQTGDLLRDRQRVLQSLAGVLVEFLRDGRVLRALERLGVDDIGRHSPELARHVLGKQCDQGLPGDGGSGVWHRSSPFRHYG
jgi:hypothetical protein